MKILPVFNGQKNQPAVNLKLHQKRRPTEQRELRRRPYIQQKFVHIIFWLIAATTLYWIPILDLGLNSIFFLFFYNMGSLSMSPYSSASSIVSILSTTILRKEREEKGDYGATKLLQYTRYTCVITSIVSSIYIALIELKPITLGWNSRQLFVVVFTLTIGSVLSMIFADMISQESLGTGMSALAVVGSREELINEFRTFYEITHICDSMIVIVIVIITLDLSFFFVYGAIGLENAYTLIALRSLKLTLRLEVSLAILPIAISYSGTNALSNANSLVNFVSFISDTNNIFNKLKEEIVTLLTALLNLLITIIGSLEIFGPDAVSKTLQNFNWILLDDNAIVIRPGDPTTKYLIFRVNQTAMIGGLLLIVLGLVSTAPTFILSFDNEVATLTSSLLNP